MYKYKPIMTVISASRPYLESVFSSTLLPRERRYRCMITTNTTTSTTASRCCSSSSSNSSIVPPSSASSETRGRAIGSVVQVLQQVQLYSSPSYGC